MKLRCFGRKGTVSRHRHFNLFHYRFLFFVAYVESNITYRPGHKTFDRVAARGSPRNTQMRYL